MLIPAGESLSNWWIERRWGNTDDPVMYTPVLFDQARPTDKLYTIDWEKGDEWLTFLTRDKAQPYMTDDERLETLVPLDDGDEDEHGPDTDDD